MKKLLSGVLAIVLLTASVAKAQAFSSVNATKNKGYNVLSAGEAIVFYKYQHLSHSPKKSGKVCT